MEEDFPLSKLAITPCAHTFCMECLQMTIERFKHCSLCRHPLGPKDVRPVALELAPTSLGTSTSSSSSSSSGEAMDPAANREERFRKYGTKLAILVEKLQELR